LDTSLIGQFKIKIFDWLIQGKKSKHRSPWVAVGNRIVSKWTVLSVAIHFGNR